MDVNRYVKMLKLTKTPGARSCPIKIPCLHLKLREVTKGPRQVPTGRGQDLNPDLQHSFQSITLLLFKVEHSQQFGKWRPSYWETISYIKAYWISLVFWKYFGQLFMMMLLLLISCLESLGHLFFFSLPNISFLTSTLFTQKQVMWSTAHFYIVLENAWGGWEKRLQLQAMWF